MRCFRTLLFLVCLLLSACNIGADDALAATPDSDNIIYVTATPFVAEALAAPTEVATEVPVALPTPSIEPMVLLQHGDNYMRNGYLEDAAGIYHTLLNYGDSVAAEYRALAAFRLGQVALRDGYFQQALDAFNLLITQFADSAHVPQAYFLRGDAYLGQSQWQLAVSDFQRYTQLRPGLIDSYVYERIADAQNRAGTNQ